MTHASRSKNLGSVAHDRSYDRVEEQNLVPDRKITPSGDKPFKHGMNSARFSASLFDKIGRGEERILSTFTRNERWERKLGMDLIRGGRKIKSYELE
ncbi:hypothetical protein TNCV_3496081 [Trichonephila clavipes]|nr:hypothetical protein TNCV_3496081 [Trichonephila clavipes]